VRQKAPLKALFLGGIIILMISCSPGGSGSPYNQSYIEFRLSDSSELGYADLQSLKVYVDPYAAFNLLSMDEDGRSVLGAYDYNAESKIYMGFEYSPLYVCRLEELRVTVTKKGSQEFLDSPEYTLTFMGELPEAASDKPYISLYVGSDGTVTLSAVDGSAGSPRLTLSP